MVLSCKGSVLALVLVAVFAFGAPGHASAKARHAKADSDGSGLFIPPAPETKPMFVMTGILPKPAPLNVNQQVSQAQMPPGSGMGNEMAPTEESHLYHPTRSVEALQIPLLFR